MRNLLLILTLCALIAPSAVQSQTPNTLDQTELAKFFKNYPYVIYNTKLFSPESEFVWPEGFLVCRIPR